MHTSFLQLLLDLEISHSVKKNKREVQEEINLRSLISLQAACLRKYFHEIQTIRNAALSWENWLVRLWSIIDDETEIYLSGNKQRARRMTKCRIYAHVNAESNQAASNSYLRQACTHSNVAQVEYLVYYSGEINPIKRASIISWSESVFLKYTNQVHFWSSQQKQDR